MQSDSHPAAAAPSRLAEDAPHSPTQLDAAAFEHPPPHPPGQQHCPPARIITTAIFISDSTSLGPLLQLNPPHVEQLFRRTALPASVVCDVLLAIAFTLLLQLWSPIRSAAPLLYLAFTLLQFSHLTAPATTRRPLPRLLHLATFLASALASSAYLRDAATNPLLTAPRTPLALLAALLLLQGPVAASLFPSLSARPSFLPTLPRYLATLALALTHLLPPAARALARPATHPATLALVRKVAAFWALLHTALMGVPITDSAAPYDPPWIHCPPLALTLTTQIFAALALPATLHYFLERHRKRAFVVSHLHSQPPPATPPPPPPPHPPAPHLTHTPNCLFLTDCDSSKLLVFFPGIFRETYATVRLLSPPAGPPPAHPPGLAVLIANHLSFLPQIPTLAGALFLAFLLSTLAAVVATRLAVALAGNQLVAWQVCRAPLLAW